MPVNCFSVNAQFWGRGRNLPRGKPRGFLRLIIMSEHIKCRECLTKYTDRHEVTNGVCLNCREDIRCGNAKTCILCDDKKSIRAFNADHRQTDGLSNVCKHCRYDESQYMIKMSWPTLIEETIYLLTNDFYWREVCDLLNVRSKDDKQQLAQEIEQRLAFDPRKITYQQFYSQFL